MHCSRGLEILQGDTATRHCGSRRGIHQKLPWHSREVDDQAVPDVSATHGTAGSAGNEGHSVGGGPLNQFSQIIWIGGSGDCLRKDSVDPSAFGICGAGPGVSAEGATKSRWRQHRPKLIMFTSYG